MSRTSGNAQPPLMRALMISLLAHLAGASLFLFTIPMRRPALQPGVIFLGSFLPKSDFALAGIRRHAPAKKSAGAGADGLYRDGHVALAINESSSEKPSFSQNVASESKRSVKMKAADTAPDPMPSASNTDIGIDATVPPRVPLTLDRQ